MLGCLGRAFRSMPEVSDIHGKLGKHQRLTSPQRDISPLGLINPDSFAYFLLSLADGRLDALDFLNRVILALNWLYGVTQDASVSLKHTCLQKQVLNTIVSATLILHDRLVSAYDTNDTSANQGWRCFETGGIVSPLLLDPSKVAIPTFVGSCDPSSVLAPDLVTCLDAAHIFPHDLHRFDKFPGFFAGASDDYIAMTV